MDVIINNPAPAAPYQAQVYTPAQGPYAGPYTDHHHHGGGFGGFLLLLVGGLLLARAVKHKKWKAYRAAASDGGHQKDWKNQDWKNPFEHKFAHWNHEGKDAATDIARERYARGEITLEELQVILSTLNPAR